MAEQLNPSYVMKKFLISSSNLKSFVVNEEDRRRIRGGKVSGIVKGFDNNVHFSAPLVVNKKGFKYYLIDGNHRYEALKHKVTKDPNFKISVWLATYKDLTEGQCRHVYKLWNIGTAQTSTDFLKAYWKTIPRGQEMLKRLPVTIYGNKTHMPIKALVGSHILATYQRKFNGGYSSGKEQTLTEFAEVTTEDIDSVVEFVEFMTLVFGKFYSGNIFYRTTPIGAFYRIWYDNKHRIKESKMVSIFKKVFATYPDVWKDATSHGGRTATNSMYVMSLDALNRGSARISFKSDNDLLPLNHEKEEEEKKVEDIVQMVRG